MALFDYDISSLRDTTPINKPIDPDVEARKRAMWLALSNLGAAIMSQQGKIGRTPGEVSGLAQLGQAMPAFTNTYTQQMGEYEQNKLKREALALKKEQVNKQINAGSRPYHAPIQTSHGFYGFDTRTGQYEPLITKNGNVLMPVPADVGLAGQKTYATKTAETKAAKEASFPKVRDTMTSLNRQWDTVGSEIEAAINEVSAYTAGLGAWSSSIPATPAKNLKERLATIRANIGFDKLQDMRANSPTGGALGQVSDLENQLLQAVQGSLDQQQSPKRLRDNLMKIKNTLERLKREKAKAFSQDYGDMMQREAAPSGEVVDNKLEVLSDDELMRLINGE